MTCRAAYAEAKFAVGASWNSSRFFRQPHIAARVNEIKARRALLADLDDAWVLRRQKPIADANADDFYAHCPETGRRLHLDIAGVPREKMAAVSEIIEEVILEPEGDRVQVVRRTRIKIATSSRDTALELIGRHIGMWPSRGAQIGVAVAMGTDAAPAPEIAERRKRFTLSIFETPAALLPMEQTAEAK